VLILLAIQLAHIATGSATRVVAPSALELGVAPIVGAGIALGIGFEDPIVARTFVLECATPAAILPLVLVLAYDDGVGEEFSPAQYVSTTILVTTLLGVLVLSGVIVLLRSSGPF
jgi:predicted permease